ncbi:hypothetical protein YSA_00893 [Pseudomonas putida ND6]|uniref:Uncharacterized protein n=1 Tax=Pseudomonas putida ND6 TaxID=231023 RepID=I3UP39_PSEPU|nr:hypothetical protein YSA_00893 [Pseudomonas putida ND6]
MSRFGEANRSAETLLKSTESQTLKDGLEDGLKSCRRKKTLKNQGLNMN